MSTSSPAQQLRNRYGAISKHHGADHPKTLEVKRDLAAVKIESYVERIVADAPPLTPEQRDRIATLLRPASGRTA